MKIGRWPALLFILVVTAAASVFDWPGAEPEAPLFKMKNGETREGSQGSRTAAAVAQAKPLAPAKESGERFPAKGPDLFATVDFQPKPATQKRTPQPPPVAPPLPFRYQGKAIEGDRVSVFLADGARTHVVHVGSVVGNYRVEEISNSAATLIFLPLNEKQQILFGSSN